MNMTSPAILTFDAHGRGGDRFAEVVEGAAHVDAFVVGAHAADVERDVAEVVSAVDARAWEGE